MKSRRKIGDDNSNAPPSGGHKPVGGGAHKRSRSSIGQSTFTADNVVALLSVAH